MQRHFSNTKTNFQTCASLFARPITRPGSGGLRAVLGSPDEQKWAFVASATVECDMKDL